MTDLIMREKNLPANLNDLSKFVLIGRDKLQAVRAEISALSKFELAKEVHAQKVLEGQKIGELVLLAESKLGELFNSMPKVTTNHKKADLENRHGSNFLNETETSRFEENKKPKPKIGIAKGLGFSKDQVSDFQKLADNPDAVQKVIANAKENGEIPTRSAVLKNIQSAKKAAIIEKAKADIAHQIKGNETKAFLKVADGIGFKPKEKYNLLLTDPPYSTDVENIEEFAESWLPNALNYVTDDGSAYVFIGAYPNELRAYLNIQPPKHMQLIQVLVWTYKNTLGNNPKNHYKQNWQACLFYRGIKAPPLDCPLTAEQWAVQEINAPDGRLGDRFHAWQKPAEIAERFIRHTTKRGDTVFDPFACTGTFLLAAAKLGRNAYGFEIDSENAKIAFERGCVNGGNF